MSSPSIVLVTLAEARLPDAQRVAAAFAAGGVAPEVTSQTDAAFTLAWPADGDRPGSTANVTLVDRPIPWEKLEGPCATAWYWPDAESALRPHTSHLFLTLVDEGAKRLATAGRLTDVAVAAAAASSATGIVWGSTGAVHEPRAFTQLAASATPDNLPLHLWIDFRAYELDGGGATGGGATGGGGKGGGVNSGGGYGLFTTGLEALGRQELEVTRFAGDPQTLVGAAYNIAHYVLEKEATLKDSEVIGLPDESQVTIREDRSMVDPTQEVFRLEFE